MQICAKYNCVEYNCVEYNCVEYNCVEYNCVEYNCVEYNCAECNCAEYNCAECNCIEFICWSIYGCTADANTRALAVTWYLWWQGRHLLRFCQKKDSQKLAQVWRNKVSWNEGPAHKLVSPTSKGSEWGNFGPVCPSWVESSSSHVEEGGVLTARHNLRYFSENLSKCIAMCFLCLFFYWYSNSKAVKTLPEKYYLDTKLNHKVIFAVSSGFITWVSWNLYLGNGSKLLSWKLGGCLNKFFSGKCLFLTISSLRWNPIVRFCYEWYSNTLEKKCTRLLGTICTSHSHWNRWDNNVAIQTMVFIVLCYKLTSDTLSVPWTLAATSFVWY